VSSPAWSQSVSLRAGLVGTLGGAVMAIFASASVSCSPAPDKDRITDLIQPDFATYRENVDAYLSRRCGTLDCHGQPGRAYRIYSREGFRLYNVDAGLVSGLQPTTEDEIKANFQAIIALEPEELNRVMAAQGAEDAIKKWIWLRKPLRMERHKGGQAMAEDDSGYKCVVTWLRIPVVQGDGTPIPPAQRAKMSDVAKGFCAEAASFP
jgi:hypothetical protein